MPRAFHYLEAARFRRDDSTLPGLCLHRSETQTVMACFRARSVRANHDLLPAVCRRWDERCALSEELGCATTRLAQPNHASPSPLQCRPQGSNRIVEAPNRTARPLCGTRPPHGSTLQAPTLNCMQKWSTLRHALDLESNLLTISLPPNLQPFHCNISSISASLPPALAPRSSYCSLHLFRSHTYRRPRAGLLESLVLP